MRCAVSSRVWISALCVHAQRTMCTNRRCERRHWCELVVHCVLLVVRVHVPLVVVCDDGVVRCTLVLIAL